MRGEPGTEEVGSFEIEGAIHHTQGERTSDVVVHAATIDISAAGLADGAEETVRAGATRRFEDYASTASENERLETMVVPKVIDVGSGKLVDRGSLNERDDAAADRGLILGVVERAAGITIAGFNGRVGFEVEAIVNVATAGVGEIKCDVASLGLEGEVAQGAQSDILASILSNGENWN